METARLTVKSFVPRNLFDYVWTRLQNRFMPQLTPAAVSRLFDPDAAAPVFTGIPPSAASQHHCKQAATLLDLCFRLRSLPAGFEVMGYAALGVVALLLLQTAY